MECFSFAGANRYAVNKKNTTGILNPEAYIHHDAEFEKRSKAIAEVWGQVLADATRKAASFMLEDNMAKLDSRLAVLKGQLDQEIAVRENLQRQLSALTKIVSSLNVSEDHSNNPPPPSSGPN